MPPDDKDLQKEIKSERSRRLAQIESLFKMINEGLSKEEFIAAFKKLIDFVKDAKETLIKTGAENIDSLNRTSLDLAKRLEIAINDALGEALNKTGKAMDEQAAGMNLIRDKVRKIKDGHTPTKEELLDLIQPLIPIVKDGDPGIDADEEKIISAVLEKVPVSNTEELESKIKDLEKKLETESKRPRGRLGMKKITSVRSINLTSQVNGSTKTFTLPTDTLKVLGVWGTQFPVTFDQDTDFSFAGRILTLLDPVSAPEGGQTLWCLIETMFYA